MLPLHQELLLLTISDDGKVQRTAGTSTFRLAFLGACVIDLCNRERIDVDPERVVLISTEATGEPALDQVLATLSDSPEEKPLQFWLSHLYQDIPELSGKALGQLCRVGVLRNEESRFLWVLAGRKYPQVDGKEKKEAKLRIMEALFGDSLPDAEDSVLIGLANLAGTLEGFLKPQEILSLQDRLAQVGNLDLTARLVEQAIYAEQEAVATAMYQNHYMGF